MSKKKVLIFTYYWPPAGGVAVQRFLKFSKFLQEFGWEPIVITVNDGSYPFKDESLLKDVTPGMQVYHTNTFEPFEIYNLLQGKRGKSMPTVSVSADKQRTFFQRITEYIRANYFIPDARKGWKPYAVKEANRIMTSQKIDAIITTGPPHSTHLIGLHLKHQHNVKWLADLRDPWTKNLINDFLPRTSSTIEKDKALEDRVLKNADAVTVISEGMAKDFKGRAVNLHVVYNGFDEADFEVLPLTTPGFFTMRHVGNMLISMNVPELWQAISELRNEDTEFKKHFLLEIVGDAHVLPRAEFIKYGIADCVRDLGYVNHSKAIGYMKGADCLLFLVSNVPNSEVLMSGKIFEYLASGSRVLGIGPVTGNAAKLLKQCNRDEMIAFEDKEKMKAVLHQYFKKWLTSRQKFEYTGNEHLIYSRRQQCGVLAQILDNVTI